MTLGFVSSARAAEKRTVMSKVAVGLGSNPSSWQIGASNMNPKTAYVLSDPPSASLFLPRISLIALFFPLADGAKCRVWNPSSSASFAACELETPVPQVNTIKVSLDIFFK